MIDWLSVVANGFWIAGLALILAALSYHYWLAAQSGRALSEVLSTTPFRKALVIGLLLIGIGLAGTSDQWWQVALAAAVVLGCVVMLGMLYRASA